ncbi:MAG: adenosylcobinamide-GDP ribazoletransferase [Pseudomonadota bacterium]
METFHKVTMTAPSHVPKPTSPLADIGGCVRFFSRLPLPALSGDDDPSHMPAFERAAWALPVAGLVIVAPALIMVLLLKAAGAPALVAAFLFFGLGILTTGGLHEDGLADMADGLGGGATRDRKLQIMKDSRIGAYGVLALVGTIGLKAAALGALFSALGTIELGVLIALSAMASRTGMAALWHLLPPARPDGLSVAAGRPGLRAIVVGHAVTLAALAAGSSFVGAEAILALAAAGFLATALVGRMALRQIGGQTGDILGGCQQIGETAILTALALTAT